MSAYPANFSLITFFNKVSVPLARFALFVVYFWFGALKIFGLSPASSLVENLFNHTMPIMPFGTFMIIFGLFECLIGILFIIPRAERLAIFLMFLHLFMTIMPIFLLPEVTWVGFLVPTLEGQYIIKNILIVAAAVTVGATIRPMKKPND